MIEYFIITISFAIVYYFYAIDEAISNVKRVNIGLKVSIFVPIYCIIGVAILFPIFILPYIFKSREYHIKVFTDAILLSLKNRN